MDNQDKTNPTVRAATSAPHLITGNFVPDPASNVAVTRMFNAVVPVSKRDAAMQDAEVSHAAVLEAGTRRCGSREIALQAAVLWAYAGDVQGFLETFRAIYGNNDELFGGLMRIMRGVHMETVVLQPEESVVYNEHGEVEA